MKTITKITFALMTSLAFTSFSQDSLATIVDHQLVTIAPNNGALGANTIDLVGISANEEAMRLTWCAPSNCYFACIFSGALTADIARIKPDGTYTNLGSVTVPGQTVFGVETLAYDNNSGKLYISASLNGADATTESLLEVDTATLIGSVVGTFSHIPGNQEPECDGLTISEDGSTLYYYEVHGGGAPFTRIYSQPLDMSSGPTIIYNQPNPTGLNGISVLGDELYFCQPRGLHKLDLANSNAYSMVATLFTSNDFNGDVIWGLSDKFVKQTSSLYDISETTVIVYPNPSGGLLKVVSELPIKNVKVFSMQLGIVRNVEGDFDVIDISDCAAGNYIVQIQFENGKVRREKITVD